MKRFVVRGFLFALSLAVAQPVLATTINFGVLSQAGTGQPIIGQTLSTGGLTFTSNTASPYGLAFYRDADPWHPVGGSAATSLMEYAADSITTITQTGGGVFDLTSIDFAPYGAVQSSFPSTFNVTITGLLPNLSTVTQNVTVQNLNNPGNPLLQTFALVGFSGVTQITMTQGTYYLGTAFQFNNLVVNGTSTAPVPEPGSLLLLGSGLAAIALAFKRTRSSANR